MEEALIWRIRKKNDYKNTYPQIIYVKRDDSASKIIKHAVNIFFDTF